VPIAVLDIPLLFETGADARCDAVLVVTVPPYRQAWRVLERPGMTSARLLATRRNQAPETLKWTRADYLVPTGLGLYDTRRRLAHVLADLKGETRA